MATVGVLHVHLRETEPVEHEGQWYATHAVVEDSWPHPGEECDGCSDFDRELKRRHAERSGA